MPGRSPADVPDVDAQYVALAAPSRRRLLDVLRSAGAPVGAGEVAATVGLHVTTARAHLRVLQAAGLVQRLPPAPAGRGRPRHLYAPVPDEAPGEEHRQLAELLAGALDAGADEGRRRAEEAGRRWAVQQVSADAGLSWEQALGGLDLLFRRLGFAPRRVEADPGRFRLALEHCPFREVARAHPQVVCAVHLGLMRGALSRMGWPAVAGSAALQPFVTPELCLAEVPEVAGRSGHAAADASSEE